MLMATMFCRCGLWCVALAAACVEAIAATPPAPAPVAARVLSACDDAAAWSGGSLDTAADPEGRPGIRWAHAESPTLSLREVPSDWSAWNALEVRLYSAAATGSRFLVYVGSENPESAGPDYYASQIRLDFTGWRTLRLPLAELGASRSPRGWQHIDALRFLASGWDNTPHPEAVVVMGDVRLVHAPPVTGPRLSDAEFFAALDLGLPALSAVQAAVAADDWPAARRAFAQYLRQRTTPRWHVEPQQRPRHASRPAGVDTRAADRVVAHELTSCGIAHQFGPDIDWSINPTPLRYPEWTWQLSRHAIWVSLARAYWATGDETYAREFTAQLRDWISDNPVPVNASGNHVGSRWRTIEAGIRMLGNWPDCFFHFLSSPSFDDDAVVLMVTSMLEHARHLMAHPTGNNWLAMEMNGLFHVGALFPEFTEARLWRETAAGRLYEEMAIQVYPDGAQVELAPGYHGVSLGCFQGTLKLAELNGIALPGDYAERFEKMIDVYQKLAMPDGLFPALNDSGWGDCRRPLRAGAERFPQRQDWLWVGSSGQEGQAPAFTSVAFPYAGWAVMRSGWGPEDLYLHFEYGPFGAAHQHEDKLSLVMHAHGRRLLTEGGVYAYDSSPWRRYVLSTRAHNTIMVDGLEQHRRGQRETFLSPEPLPNRWITTAQFDFAEGWFDEGYGPDRDRTVTHRRAVLFVKPDLWLVVDRLSPTDAASHRYEAIFHMDADEADVLEAPLAVCSRGTDQPRVAIVPLAPSGLTAAVVKGQEEPAVQGWVPAGGYAMRPIATPIFSISAPGTVLLPWLIVPLRAGQALPIRAVRSEASGEEAVFSVDLADGRRHVLRLPLATPAAGTTGGLHWSTLENDRLAAEIRIAE